MKHLQKYVKIYKDGGGKIFQKSQANQPNQGHQPWQSNSLLAKGRGYKGKRQYSEVAEDDEGAGEDDDAEDDER